ncbi:hypothetical protein DPMN_099404 [Dreissena polymorpha]|uniref:Uncharacterized protein n=1 Tax=Dreissena polymorpha TaxID=45954 RepID=A0A9D4LFF6_DREPO|nr:hypothetical protein DPMN_099404 [Dreissena polymorpha]
MKSMDLDPLAVKRGITRYRVYLLHCKYCRIAIIDLGLPVPLAVLQDGEYRHRHPVHILFMTV